MSNTNLSRVSQAVQLFRDGCACSQAILAVYGEPLGLPREQAMRIAAGFAAGMRIGETCGAVTGAVMVLGLLSGGSDCHKSSGRAMVNAQVRDFLNRFRERNGSVVCRDLLKCDIGTRDGMKQAREHNLFRTTCVKAVQDAAEILEEMH